jgi:ABC-type multidrug transport system fused ATPase/permease subunit
MSGFISLSCPACGAKLTITDDKDRFICDYCNNEQLIDRTVQTVSHKSEVEITAKIPELMREAPSELTLSRLKQEVSDLEGTLDEIGMPVSIGEVITSATCGILICFIFAGALFFGAWAGREINLEGTPLLFVQFPLVVIGIGILSSAFGVIKKGAEGIAKCRRDTRRRDRTLELLNSTLNEMDKRQAAAFVAQSKETSKELAAEHAIRRLKNEIAKFQNQIDEVDNPESLTSILISTLLGIIVVALISNWFISSASSQTLPAFMEILLLCEEPLPPMLWWILGFLGIVFAILPLKAIEGGIQKLNAHTFYVEELGRLEARLAPKTEELEVHRNSLSQLLV